MNEIDEIKQEMAQLKTQMDNVEGYFDNFDMTLSNHMNDYKREQAIQTKRLEEIERSQKNLKTLFNLGFWILFGLTGTLYAAIIAILVVVLSKFFEAL